jgi:hypothetical protein
MQGGRLPECKVMITWKPKLWVGLGAAALSLGVAGCGETGATGGESGGAATAQAGEAASGETGGEGGASAANASAGSASAANASAGEAASGETGGEAGAVDAYATVPEASRRALRIAHLAGFLAIAEQVAATGDAAAASVLIQQGLLEVHQPAAADYSGKAAAIKPAYEAAMAALDAGKPKPEVDAAFKAARDAQAAAMVEVAGDPVAVTKAMLAITSGLYGLVVTPAGVDPVEYQHAMGAALSARDVLAGAEPALSARNRASFAEAQAAMTGLVGLFAAPVAPETPAAPAAVLAAAARVELPLSDLGR